ncbi:uncharacterized protein ACWYII_033586 isoform 1-T2 [Salvelinus alpinus]
MAAGGILPMGLWMAKSSLSPQETVYSFRDIAKNIQQQQSDRVNNTLDTERVMKLANKDDNGKGNIDDVQKFSQHHLDPYSRDRGTEGHSSVAKKQLRGYGCCCEVYRQKVLFPSPSFRV